MKKRILNYISEIDNLLKEAPDSTDWKSEIKKHLIQTSFFQHERLIHLIVTITFAILTMMSFIFCIFMFSPVIFILTLLFFILLIPYISHYYILENNVQKMYSQYDEMLKKAK